MNTEKEKELKRKMHKLKIFEKDIKEIFMRSSGPGGQNINKVSTCVYLHHIPTGIKVKYQKERSQKLNRYGARFLLFKKIEKKKREDELRIYHQMQKEKRRTRNRPKILKEKILKQKRFQSEKKSARKKIDTKNLDKYL